MKHVSIAGTWTENSVGEREGAGEELLESFENLNTNINSNFSVMIGTMCT